MMGIRAAVLGMSFGVLTACSTTSPLGTGDTTADQLNSREIPIGKQYRFDISLDQVPLKISSTYVTSRASENRLEFTGETLVKVTDPNLAEALISGGLLGGGANAPVFNGETVRTKLSYITDNRGRSIDGSFLGFKTRYSPHDCFATIGTCRFVETADGETTHFVSETTENGGTWTTVQSPDPAKSPSATQSVVMRYTLDQDGVVKNADLRFSQDGGTFNMSVRRTK